MGYVYLRSDGFYSRIKEDIEKLNAFEFSRRLLDTLEIEDGVTIENIFDILMEFEDDVNILFRSWTRGFKLGPYYEDLKKDPDNKIDLDFIEISWSSEVTTWENDDCVEQSEFELYPNISGIDDSVNIENISFKKSRYYSISLSRLSDFKHLPIKLNKEFKVTSFGDGVNTLLESTKDWNIWNSVGAILNEISFHGYPEDHEDIIGNLREIENKIDSGEEEMIPMEKIMIEMLEKDLIRLEKEEKFEKAAKVKAKIEEYKLKLKEYKEED